MNEDDFERIDSGAVCAALAVLCAAFVVGAAIGYWVAS